LAEFARSNGGMYPPMNWYHRITVMY
jgi:hypothetical protein